MLTRTRQVEDCKRVGTRLPGPPTYCSMPVHCANGYLAFPDRRCLASDLCTHDPQSEAIKSVVVFGAVKQVPGSLGRRQYVVAYGWKTTMVQVSLDVHGPNWALKRVHVGSHKAVEERKTLRSEACDHIPINSCKCPKPQLNWLNEQQLRNAIGRLM